MHHTASTALQSMRSCLSDLFRQRLEPRCVSSGHEMHATLAPATMRRALVRPRRAVLSTQGLVNQLRLTTLCHGCKV